MSLKLLLAPLVIAVVGVSVSVGVAAAAAVVVGYCDKVLIEDERCLFKQPTRSAVVLWCSAARATRRLRAPTRRLQIVCGSFNN